MNKRDLIVSNSIKYEGVKFRHLGRNHMNYTIKTDNDKKKIVLDCAGLVIETLRVSGLLAENNDIEVYDKRPDGHSLVSHMNKVCDLKRVEDLEKGDILLMQFNNEATHLAIYLGKLYNNEIEYFIHSYALSRKVEITNFSETWRKSVVGVYSIKNIDN